MLVYIRLLCVWKYYYVYGNNPRHGPIHVTRMLHQNRKLLRIKSTNVRLSIDVMSFNWRNEFMQVVRWILWSAWCINIITSQRYTALCICFNLTWLFNGKKRIILTGNINSDYFKVIVRFLFSFLTICFTFSFLV